MKFILRMTSLRWGRLRVVSNFSDGDCGEGEIHERARNRVETRREEGAESQSVGGVKQSASDIQIYLLRLSQETLSKASSSSFVSFVCLS